MMTSPTTDDGVGQEVVQDYSVGVGPEPSTQQVEGLVVMATQVEGS